MDVSIEISGRVEYIILANKSPDLLHGSRAIFDVRSAPAGRVEQPVSVAVQLVFKEQLHCFSVRYGHAQGQVRFIVQGQ